MGRGRFSPVDQEKDVVRSDSPHHTRALRPRSTDRPIRETREAPITRMGRAAPQGTLPTMGEARPRHRLAETRCTGRGMGRGEDVVQG